MMFGGVGVFGVGSGGCSGTVVVDVGGVGASVGSAGMLCRGILYNSMMSC